MGTGDSGAWESFALEEGNLKEVAFRSIREKKGSERDLRQPLHKISEKNASVS